MEWSSIGEILSYVGTVISTLGGVGFYNYIFNRKNFKRESEADVVKKEISNLNDYAASWKEIAEERDKSIDEQAQRIKVLQAQIDELEKEVANLKFNLRALQLEDIEFRTMQCHLLDCEKRLPSRKQQIEEAQILLKGGFNNNQNKSN